MMTSTEPITVTISHRLGRDEAKKRLDNGLSAIRGEIAAYVRSLDYSWDEYTLNFRVSALMQTITGRIEVYEEFVRVELGLPLAAAHGRETHRRPDPKPRRGFARGAEG